MELKEVHILNNTLHGLLTETAQNTLKQKIGSEKEYAKYLIALLEAVIGKRTSPSLKDLLNLLGISHIQNDLQQKATDIIEDIADLHFQGYDSEYTKWLKESKNEAFIIHLAFLKETKSGISHTERESLKNKLINIDKLDTFEFEEKDIRSGIRMAERARLKKWFNELYIELGTRKVKTPVKSKFVLVLCLILTGSIIFAILNPTVRHFIAKQYHKLMDETSETESNSESIVKSVQTFPAISDSLSNGQTDSIQEKPEPDIKEGKIEKNKVKKDSLKKVSEKNGNIIGMSTESVAFDNYYDEPKTEKDFEKYFKVNKKNLHPIEGFWMLHIKEKSNVANSIKINCAIIRTQKNKYEVIHLNKEGNIENLPNNGYFELSSTLQGYNFHVLVEKTILIQSKATLKTKEGILIFESEYDARLFNPKNKKEMIRCKVSGYSKSTYDESTVNEK